MPSSPLPIEPALPRLATVLRDRTSAVLLAPPGAGKTTRVPLALLDEPWLAGRRILMLEPRRLAARAAATYMARLLGGDVGGTVGYRTRLDTRVSGRTRLEVLTEGVLTRMLQSDPELGGVGLVIFDEFHERSLNADLGLALVLETRDVLREELRVLVMSATLEGEPIAALLGGAGPAAAIVTTKGRSWPVETHHLRRPLEGRIEAAVARTILQALEDEPSAQGTPHAGANGVLAFLPGAPEIHRVHERLQESGLPAQVTVHPLYGDLAREDQDRAIAPAPPGLRKVVLATSIAETSLTIDGIGVVVDSGLMRVPRFDPRTGMTRLATVPVTRSSADQRRGRAGRLGPGRCYRLWTPGQEAALLARGTPEILEADLGPLALDLAAWGVRDPATLRWLDPPPTAACAQARQLLAQLGALEPEGAPTEHGRRMAALPTHPRLAHMLLVARERGLGILACELAALLSERDVVRAPAGGGRQGRPYERPDADVRLRLEALRRASGGRGAPADAWLRGHALDRGALARAAAEARMWRRRLGIAEPPSAEPHDLAAAGLLLALAYPDRIAQRRPGQVGRFLLRNGRGAALDEGQPLARSDWIVAAELDGEGRESRIFLAAPVERVEIEQEFAAQIEEDTTVAWDDGADAVRGRRQSRLGALVLSEAVVPADPARASAALLARVRARGIDSLAWSPEAKRLRQRLAFLHRFDPAVWPDVADPALQASLDRWLAPWLGEARTAADLERVDLRAALEALLPWERRRALDELAPSHVEVPSGSRIAIDYGDPDNPVLAVRLQEVFGLTETPRVGGGRVPLTLHLLSPAHRPVQVTRDLASFWRDAYFQVRKDLKGRYPKHFWPDDPLSAPPTRRTRPR